jgi:hypothetical protein
MLAGISLLMLACTMTRVLRVSDAVCTSANPDTECPLDSVQHIQPAGSAEPMYSLGIVELDDQGPLQRRSQMQSVLDEVTRVAATETTTTSMLFSFTAGSTVPLPMTTTSRHFEPRCCA